MRIAARAATGIAIAAAVLVGPAALAAHASGLGQENVVVHVDNNNLVAPLCVTLHVSSASAGNILGPTTICLP